MSTIDISGSSYTKEEPAVVGPGRLMLIRKILEHQRVQDVEGS
jgi:hypothetical protein